MLEHTDKWCGFQTISNMSRKAKKKRSHDGGGAAAAVPPSPINNKSGVVESARQPSTPTTMINNININNDSDDPSKWSKSKKKRMRKKRRDAAKKKLLMGAGETGANSGSITNIVSSPTKKTSLNDSAKSLSSPSTPSSSKSNTATDDDVGGNHSKKRHKKNPEMEICANPPTATSDRSTTENNLDDRVLVSNGGSNSPKKKKKDDTEGESMHIDGDSNATVKSPSKHSVDNSPQKICENQTVATDGDPSNNNSPKKKKKKKKKKSPISPQTDQAQKSPTDTKTTSGSENDNETAVPIANNGNKNVKSNSNNSSPKLKITLPKSSQMSTLQKAFLERLTSSRFRELNEELYTHTSSHSFEYFTNNPELFDQYHVGFRKQAEEWPVNPVDVIYKKIVTGWRKDHNMNGTKEMKGEMNGDVQKKCNKQVVVADFGCGDAKLAQRLLALQIGSDGQSLTTSQSGKNKKKKNAKNQGQQQSQSSSCPFKVHSFDLVSGGNELVTPADMSNVPLPNESIDVGVYSLALMGTNVADFVREAWRVLKFNGVLRVAEVRSRFETAANGADDYNNNNDTRDGGGKRGKLNNGMKKQSLLKKKKNNNHTSTDNNGDHSDVAPLMVLDEFFALMERCGFQCTNMDRNNKMFIFMDFVKVDGSSGLGDKERFTAKPCIYKRR